MVITIICYFFRCKAGWCRGKNIKSTAAQTFCEDEITVPDKMLRNSASTKNPVKNTFQMALSKIPQTKFASNWLSCLAVLLC